MELSDTVIRALAAGKILGNAPPYSGGDADAVERHLRGVVADLADSSLIKLKADFDHHGSGYASYVNVFCWLGDGSGTENKPEATHFHGLTVLLCRQGPLATWGANWEVRNKEGGGGAGFPEWENVGEMPRGDWSRALAEIEGKLARRGFRVLGKRDLEPMLAPDVKVRSAFNPPYRVFDAIFHWLD